MVKTSKVVYQPDSTSTEHFTVIVNTEEFKKWKAGEVVDSFQVFHSTQGAQGVLGKPSNQQLETVFGTKKDVDVVTVILEKGKEQAGDGVATSFTGTNTSRGNNDTR
ncbi:ribosome maturation protein [Mycena rebaudengoi]|nr:ribosome maturation protein [Mycena rebaudengoi]